MSRACSALLLSSSNTSSQTCRWMRPPPWRMVLTPSASFASSTWRPVFLTKAPAAPLPARILPALAETSPIQVTPAVPPLHMVSLMLQSSNFSTNVNMAELEFADQIKSLSHHLDRSKRIVPEKIKGAINMIKRLATPVSAEDALVLLRCCGAALCDERPLVRTQIALELWKQLEDSGTNLDTKHYNALLSAHLDNDHRFSPVEFLSWMQEKGVTANRHTYMHLLARFAAAADTDGAGIMLAQMREENMPVNEYVFHSLILAQSSAGEIDAARQTLESMRTSALAVGSGAYSALLTGMIRSGECSGEDIVKEFEQIIRESNVVMDDHAGMQLILELIKANEVKAAKVIQSQLPRRSGFFHVMRNVVPQLIFLGHADFAFDLYLDSSTSLAAIGTYEDTLGGNTGETSHIGLFVLRAMAKMEHPPEKAITFLEHMLANRLNRQCVARTLEACIDHGKLEYGAAILKLAREKLGEDCVRAEDFHRYHSQTLQQAESVEQAIRYVASLNTLGVKMEGKAISQSLMPKVMVDKPQLRDVVTRLMPYRNVFSPTQLANNGFLFLLCQETKEDFNEAASFMLHNKMVWKPLVWNASLSRAYLATGDLDCLISIFFVASMINHDRHNEEHEVYLFRSLAHMLSNSHRYNRNASPEECLSEVLNEMKKLEIGIPPSAATLLVSNLNLDSTKVLLEDLQQIYENKDELWPWDRKLAFMKERRKVYTSSRGRLSLEEDGGLGNQVKTGVDGYIPEDQIPNDPHQMMALFDSLLERGQLNMNLTRRLQQVLMDKGMLDKLVHVVCKASEHEFMPLPMALEKTVSKLLNLGRLPDALTLVNYQLNASARPSVYSSTISAVCLALAKQGHHDKVADLLGNLNKGKVLGYRFIDLQHYYASRTTELGDEGKLVLELLNTRGLLPQQVPEKPVLLKEIDAGEHDRAIELFQAFARDERKLRHKHELCIALLQAGDKERLQKVLDISSSLIGLTKTKYDLAGSLLSLDMLLEAKKALAGVSYDREKTSYICRNLAESGKVNKLVDFVRCTAQVRNCDRELVYLELSRACQRVGDADAAEEAWDMMQEEGFVPSRDVLTMIAEVLEGAGREVPFKKPRVRRRRNGRTSMDVA